MSTDQPTPAELWELRYGVEEYVYGTDPNDFLVEAVVGRTPGRALCIADGEGRNGVYLASLGHQVTSVDLTEAGMAKAARLAQIEADHAEAVRLAGLALERAISAAKSARASGKGVDQADLEWRRAKARMIELETGEAPDWSLE